MKFSEKSLNEKLLLNESWRKKYQDFGDVEAGTSATDAEKSDDTLETVWTSTSCTTTSRPPSPPEDIVVASTRGVLCLALVLTSILVLIVLLGSNLL